jgi:tripartite-type tricarboxylate transporter receptor subunit TctC
VFLAMWASFVSGSASSQTTRTIKLVLGVAAGGLTDAVARLLAEQISQAQRLTIVVENRPGAGTAIAAEAVSRAAPDGNTILMTANSFVINPQLRKVNYNPLRSFEPICNLARSPQFIVVNNASPHRTLSDLFGAARARPGDMTLGSVGPGSGLHLTFELLKRAANVQMTHVPYPGTTQAVTALLGAHVTSVAADYVDVIAQIRAGKLHALVTTWPTRLELLPDVPTVAESGYGDYQTEGSFGIVAPAKTPAATVSQLADWFSAALQVVTVKTKLATQGLFPAAICGADFAAYLRKQYDLYGRIIHDAKLRGQ